VQKIIFFIALIGSHFLSAQSLSPSNGPADGVCPSNCVQPADGSGILGFTYRKDTCGLSYLVIKERLGQRLPPPGVIQPCTLAVAGLPACFHIEKAFLWCDASGSGSAITAGITNPANNTMNFPMTIIGSGPDKCWGYTGSYSYRADVTSIVSGNGNYIFTGLPVNTPDDVDGIAMMIIYRDPTATWEGHMLIQDGADLQIASATSQSLININACGNSTTANAFFIIGDVQNVGSVVSVNNTALNFNQVFWNYEDNPVSQITPATVSIPYSVTASSDCYNLMMIGIYYQTTSCNACPYTASLVDVTVTGDTFCLPGSASITATATGGSPPYTYVWQPGNYTGATVNNIPTGTYTVTATDATGCLWDTAVVTVTGLTTPVVTLMNDQLFCDSVTSVLLDAGNPGLHYLWNTGDTTQTITINSSGTFYVTVSNGPCSHSDTVTLSLLSYISLGDSIIVCSLENGILLNPLANGTSYLWSTGETLQTITVQSAGIYWVQIQNGNCLVTDSIVVIQTEGEFSFYIPNTITPNGDGKNDVFRPVGLGISDFTMQIYNRWGELLFETTDPSQGWNGFYKNTVVQEDTYVYVITYSGTCVNNSRVNKIGHLNVIR
jgi:gliding motility-associated-like protein